MEQVHKVLLLSLKLQVLECSGCAHACMYVCMTAKMSCKFLSFAGMRQEELTVLADWQQEGGAHTIVRRDQVPLCYWGGVYERKAQKKALVEETLGNKL